MGSAKSLESKSRYGLRRRVKTGTAAHNWVLRRRTVLLEVVELAAAAENLLPCPWLLLRLFSDLSILDVVLWASENGLSFVKR
jgi:hypothetical protein